MPRDPASGGWDGSLPGSPRIQSPQSPRLPPPLVLPRKGADERSTDPASYADPDAIARSHCEYSALQAQFANSPSLPSSRLKIVDNALSYRHFHTVSPASAPGAPMTVPTPTIVSTIAPRARSALGAALQTSASLARSVLDLWHPQS